MAKGENTCTLNIANTMVAPNNPNRINKYLGSQLGVFFFLKIIKPIIKFNGNTQRILKLMAVAVWSVKNQRKISSTPASPVTKNSTESKILLLVLFL